jgi:hypothetical protein
MSKYEPRLAVSLLTVSYYLAVLHLPEMHASLGLLALTPQPVAHAAGFVTAFWLPASIIWDRHFSLPFFPRPLSPNWGVGV